MAHSGESPIPAGRSPETVDRLMVGVCGAIWLVLLAVSAIATVALVQLGSGHRPSGGSGSSWLLYTIIVISAVVILGAIPLLIRARRAALAAAAPAADTGSAESPERASDPLPTSPRAEAPTEKLRVFGAAVDPYLRKPSHARPVSRINVVLERIWLRGTTSLLGAMGLALTAVATATYLLATHTDTAAWVALGLAGAITAAMAGILVTFQRRLAHAADEAADQALA
ncbi:MAG TPA: DUF2561 family protein [Mycobacterium sp.]|uniref:DUF2561 family protein n=1 Tax=Mycolicibacterium sp. TaxID=2320850 RepID=UPI0025F6BF9F|nr:DUF2561 family protein [Mycolicibacterium sp.]HPX36234.1 DUF2561 family protein [Mycobacterium sp.]HQC75348.1 DUF2561 family protein [Mycobacterium sp.]